MKLIKLISFIAIILHFLQSKAWKDKEDLSIFLQKLNLKHLDLIVSDSLLYDIENILDEEFDNFIQIIHNQSWFFSGSQSCKISSLHILQLEYLFYGSEDNCTSTPGTFIKNPCVTYFAYTETYPNDNIFKKVKCLLDHQPYIFVLVKINYMNYELLEVQIPHQRMLVIATWDTTNDIR